MLLPPMVITNKIIWKTFVYFFISVTDKHMLGAAASFTAVLWQGQRHKRIAEDLEWVK